MATTTNDAFSDAIIAAINEEVKKQVEAEIEKAVEQVRQALNHQVDNIALSILRNYEVHRLQDTIVIRVVDKLEGVSDE